MPYVFSASTVAVAEELSNLFLVFLSCPGELANVEVAKSLDACAREWLFLLKFY